MVTLLYIIWWSIPVFFFFMALWAYLESRRIEGKLDSYKDFFRQGIFVTCCVIASILIDRYFLAWVSTNIFMDALPLGFFQVLLLPFVMLIAAYLVGGSDEIRILRAPHPTDKKKPK